MNLELAWAAGLFDASGTATTCGSRARLAVKKADGQVVRRFAAAVGIGKVYGPYGNESMTRRDGSPRIASFIWIAEEEDAHAVARLLLPYLCDEKAAAIRRVCRQLAVPATGS